MMPVCFAIGSIWRWDSSLNRDVLLDYARELDVDGVEITLSRKEEVLAFSPSKRNLKWLRSLKHNSLHAPFSLLRCTERGLHMQLRKLEEISREIHADNVVIHPDSLPPKDILSGYRMNIVAENLVPRWGFTQSKIDAVMRHYDIGLCLDVCHAYLWNPEEAGRYVRRFRPRIRQVHFSAAYRKRDHLTFHDASKSFVRSVKPVRALKVPIIIEEDFLRKDMALVRKEVSAVRKFFC